MRQRTTFIHGADEAFDPEQFQVNLKTSSLQVQSLETAREDQWIFSSSELPVELSHVLKQWHELHIRWTSELSYRSIVPFVSRFSPGLHIFFTPQRTHSTELLCPLIQEIFGRQLSCTSHEKTFTRLSLLSERFATSAAKQYYSLLHSLRDLVNYIQLKICPPSSQACFGRAELLLSADYVDIDYDTISQTLTLTSFHHVSPPGGWTGHYSRPTRSTTVEVGILAPQKATQHGFISLAGLLAVVGKDEKPTPTMFSFPSRHHTLSMSTDPVYTASFPNTTGLHPKLRLSFPAQSTPPTEGCTLHTYSLLPSSLFVDKYELERQNLLFSSNLRAMRSLSGETDLEVPNWLTRKWGSATLLQLSPPYSPGKHDVGKGQLRSWKADIPLHLRYMHPETEGMSIVEVPWPTVFWACPADGGTKMGNSPFDRIHLGYESLFGPRTMFYHLTPQPQGHTGGERISLVERVKVPVLDNEKVGNVEMGTVVIVFLGVLWVGAKLAGIAWTDRKRREEDKTG